MRAIDASNQTAGGETGANQIRISPADYPDDGSGTTIISSIDRANARTISNAVVHQDGVIPNARGMSNWTWAWGQFLDHDIDLTETASSNGTADIEIEDDDDPLGPSPIAFDRSDFASGTGLPGVPREQVNSITSFIDASNVYGSNETRSAMIREFSGGRLRTSDGDMPPINDVGLPNAGAPGGFLVGDIRGNENVVLTSLHTLFIREHNRLCHLIELLDPDASDEQIYQLARKIVQAELQQISYNEFIPALLGEGAALNPVVSPSVPSISTEFATASYRFGHSMLSTNIEVGESGTIHLSEAFFNPTFLMDNPANVDLLLAGLPLSPCQEIDTKVVSDLRTFLFGPAGSGGFDLAALNIQRGRDHGLSDYNSMREAFGLSRVTEFAEITSDANLQTELENLYETVDNVDAWVGGLAEDHVSGGSTGLLVRTVLLDQFSRLQSADEFYHTNDPDLQSPLVEAIIDLESISLRKVVLANTTVRKTSLSPFFTGAIEESDILVEFDDQSNRIHMIGNRENNSVLVIESEFGITIIASDGSLVNGETTVTIPAGRKPNLCVDFGGGDDHVFLVGVEFNDVVVALGDDNDSLTGLFARTNLLVSDTDSDIPPIQENGDNHSSRNDNRRKSDSKRK
ncbi:peroxidase family protein [Thalassoglobus polymorphus]|uniref:peroxidase family protein n=1 Tax=Thalassoglobus polymorphus TaxID=2527994 RepID=UPI001E4CE4A3|nr:peroxidase family protein [Thalassoglobus polymorphus]